LSGFREGKRAAIYNIFFVGHSISFVTKQRVWHQGDDSDLTVEIYQVQKTSKNIHHKQISSNEIANLAKQYDSGQQLIKK
jgi:hypothetical protein